MISNLLKIVVIGATLFVGNAIAESWIDIASAVNGEKLIASVESIDVEKYTNSEGKEGYLASAIMRYVGKDYIAPFLAAIDVEECLTKNSGVLIVALPDNTTKKYFWSDGKMMYDAQGQFLCGYVKEKYQQRKPAKPKIHT